MTGTSRTAPPGVARFADRLARQGLSPTGLLREWLADGASVRDIAGAASARADVVAAAIKHFGVDRPPPDPHYAHRKWSEPNPRVVTDPRTDTDWYWLGWLSAQSSVNGTGRVTLLDARQCDAHHLQRLVRHLGSDQPVVVVKPDLVRVAIHSADFVDALALQGITPRSQVDHCRGQPPQLTEDDPGSAAAAAWVRGVWDATASAYTSGGDAFVGITLRSPRLWAATARILRAQGVKGTSHVNNRSLHISTLHGNLVRLADLLYGQGGAAAPTVLLERQRRTLRGAVEWHGRQAPPSLTAPAAPENVFRPTRARPLSGSGRRQAGRPPLGQ